MSDFHTRIPEIPREEKEAKAIEIIRGVKSKLNYLNCGEAIEILETKKLVRTRFYHDRLYKQTKEEELEAYELKIENGIDNGSLMIYDRVGNCYGNLAHFRRMFSIPGPFEAFSHYTTHLNIYIEEGFLDNPVSVVPVSDDATQAVVKLPASASFEWTPVLFANIHYINGEGDELKKTLVEFQDKIWKYIYSIQLLDKKTRVQYGADIIALYNGHEITYSNQLIMLVSNELKNKESPIFEKFAVIEKAKQEAEEVNSVSTNDSVEKREAIPKVSMWTRFTSKKVPNDSSIEKSEAIPKVSRLSRFRSFLPSLPRISLPRSWWRKGGKTNKRKHHKHKRRTHKSKRTRRRK